MEQKSVLTFRCVVSACLAWHADMKTIVAVRHSPRTAMRVVLIIRLRLRLGLSTFRLLNYAPCNAAKPRGHAAAATTTTTAAATYSFALVNQDRLALASPRIWKSWRERIRISKDLSPRTRAFPTLPRASHL
ncbi:hypothetical protein DFH11DRAFT_1232809 [Phellopilus nigrolimitatus]|nr:hypothetical protein DFH11DRAFT_1232809 [Phellopilus nigrolimitatus]